MKTKVSQRKLVKAINQLRKRADVWVAQHSKAIDLDDSDRAYQEMVDNELSLKDVMNGEAENPFLDPRSAAY